MMENYDATGDSGLASEKNTTQTFVVNVKSKKFHRTDCENVAEIAEQNRQERKATREEMLQEGYSPCGWCTP